MNQPTAAILAAQPQEPAVTPDLHQRPEVDHTRQHLHRMLERLNTTAPAGQDAEHLTARTEAAMDAARTREALAVLATALWPRAGGTGGVPHYAAQSPARLHLQLGETCPGRWYAERAVAKARIASRKYTAQRVAATALACAGVLLAVTTVLTLATGS